MACKHIRTEFGEPVIIDGRYRVTILQKRGRHFEWLVETIEWVDGQAVYTRSRDAMEILLDQRPAE